MKQLRIRKLRVVLDETRHSAERKDSGIPLRKVAACAVVQNPYAGLGYVEDLSEIVEASAALGTLLGERCMTALDAPVESYGKAGIVGTAGEQEHVHAALTSVFGNAFREAIGGGEAWISSTKKVASVGSSIDVPLAFKDAIWVRSHYDTITVEITDAPLPTEMIVVAAVANRGRLNARVGGMTREQALEEKGQS